MLDQETTLSKEPLTCPRCGEPFTCGLAVGEAHCWCFDMPKKASIGKEQAQQGCICPKCLQALLDEMKAQGEMVLEVKEEQQITLTQPDK
ncbi:MAG: cysteine-rich CWC family protein [Anaerolineaceae bacterium]|nr:cysteine-rich CWC family protein [Anaerolineaceae bacterium]